MCSRTKDSVTIYGLVDPETGTLRHIGVTKWPVSERLRHDLKRSQKRAQAQDRWLASLAQRGLTPELVTLETVQDGSWRSSLEFWVEYYRSIGSRLVEEQSECGSVMAQAA